MEPELNLYRIVLSCQSVSTEWKSQAIASPLCSVPMGYSVRARLILARRPAVVGIVLGMAAGLVLLPRAKYQPTTAFAPFVDSPRGGIVDFAGSVSQPANCPHVTTSARGIAVRTKKFVIRSTSAQGFRIRCDIVTIEVHCPQVLSGQRSEPTVRSSTTVLESSVSGPAGSDQAVQKWSTS